MGNWDVRHAKFTVKNVKKSKSTPVGTTDFKHSFLPPPSHQVLFAVMVPRTSGDANENHYNLSVKYHVLGSVLSALA